MKSLRNSVQLIGRLGKDPEVKTFNEKKKASFSIATSETYKNQKGEKVEDTQWHNIAIFGGAVVPLLTGVLADLSGSLGIALLMPAACYAIIAYFGYFARRPHAALAGAAHH